jgi:BirA family transcriptional regulator, biotin operon repressor / biotin---[acetyl-CoA-carboxylase] ligase
MENVRALDAARVHLRRTDSTNDRARVLALAGAPHGTVVSASEQTAGRGRQGRSWSAPAGKSLLMSVLLRDPPELLSLIAAVALSEAIGPAARIKWPNDVVFEQSSHLLKVAGILIEGRPQEGWAVLGIGVNVAVEVEDLPAEVRHSAGTLGLSPAQVEPLLERLLESLERALCRPTETILSEWSERDALHGRQVSFERGSGSALGVDAQGRLIVQLSDGTREALDAGEVHLDGGYSLA